MVPDLVCANWIILAIPMKVAGQNVSKVQSAFQLRHALGTNVLTHALVLAAKMRSAK